MKNLKNLFTFSLLMASSVGWSNPTVIYGTDDRQDLYEITDPAVIEAAHSTMTFSIRGLINPLPNGDYSLMRAPLKDSLTLCPEVKFREQQSIGACSATLVSPKHLLTAGHCMPDQKRCEEIYLLFGFHITRKGEEFLETIPGKDVYRCKKLLVRQQNDIQDYALIELDREVTDRRPVTLGYNEKLNKNDKVRMIGYPDGIPSKVVSGAVVRKSTSTHFTSDLDAFQGNSGSGIFNEATGNMVGILFKGNKDYLWDNNRQCNYNWVCKNECPGEAATSISGIWSIISPYLKK